MVFQVSQLLEHSEAQSARTVTIDIYDEDTFAQYKKVRYLLCESRVCPD